MNDIMKTLHPVNDSKNISLHTIFGLIAQSYQSRTSVCEQPTISTSTKSAFVPFQASKCGDWRSIGSIKNIIQTTNETIQLESSGDIFTFSIPPAKPTHHKKDKDSSSNTTNTTPKEESDNVPLVANVVKIRKILANNSYESVWDISIELNGRRYTGTVSSYRTGPIGSQNTEIDGKFI